MQNLTQIEGPFNNDTKIIINGQEILSKKGFVRAEKKVGVAFGTARNTAGRRSTDLPVVVYEVDRFIRPKPKVII